MGREAVTFWKSEFLSTMPRCAFYEFTDKQYEFKWKYDARNKLWLKNDAEITEYCYKIPLADRYCLKIFSSVDRRTDLSKGTGKDSIKIVAANIDTLKPIRPRYTHTYRIETWRENFTLHIKEALEDLGNEMNCRCGGEYVLKKNSIQNWNFLGCNLYNKDRPCPTKNIMVNRHN